MARWPCPDKDAGLQADGMVETPAMSPGFRRALPADHAGPCPAPSEGSR